SLSLLLQRYLRRSADQFHQLSRRFLPIYELTRIIFLTDCHRTHPRPPLGCLARGLPPHRDPAIGRDHRPPAGRLDADRRPAGLRARRQTLAARDRRRGLTAAASLARVRREGMLVGRGRATPGLVPAR